MSNSEGLDNKAQLIEITELDKQKLINHLREALNLIWHIAPLPTQSEHERLRRIHLIAREAYFNRPLPKV